MILARYYRASIQLKKGFKLEKNITTFVKVLLFKDFLRKDSHYYSMFILINSVPSFFRR